MLKNKDFFTPHYQKTNNKKIFLCGALQKLQKVRKI